MNRPLPQDLALLTLRVAGLALALAHGWDKVSVLAQGGDPRVLPMIVGLGLPAPRLFAWAAGLAEFAGGLAVAVGLGTRVAALFPAFAMGVALFGHHRAHRLAFSALGLAPVAPPADLCRLELALTYLLPLLAIAILGPGRYSLDAVLSRRRGLQSRDADRGGPPGA